MITFRNLTLGERADHPALIGVNAELPAGAVSAIVSPDGSGQVELLSAVLGLLAPIDGLVRVEGLNPAVEPLAVRRRVCFVPRDAPLLPHLSVLEHVRFLAAVGGHERAEDRAVVRALRRGEVPDRLMRQRTSRLTYFERLCVWLAIHQLRGTAILVLDDPAGTLSGRLARVLTRLLRETLSDSRSVVLTGRDLVFAAGVADRLFRIERGRLVRQTATQIAPGFAITTTSGT